MDLESRTFSKFYPAKLDDSLYLSRSHGVTSAGFSLMPNFFYDFGIVSPSTQGGRRRYELSFARQAPSENMFPEDYFRGLLGESLMRIVIMEFLRQQKDALGINKFSMLKIDPQNTVVRRSGGFSLEHQSRYNINLSTTTPNSYIVGEYDGIIEYRTAHKKGLLVMESKTGIEGIFSNPDHHKEGILNRYCHSLQDLFPSYEIDFLFMGIPSVLFGKYTAVRKVKDNFLALNTILHENNTGLILFNFPIKKEDFKKMANQMSKYHKLRNEEFPTSCASTRYVENESFMWLIDGKRITKILESTGSNSWNEIYSIK